MLKEAIQSVDLLLSETSHRPNSAAPFTKLAPIPQCSLGEAIALIGDQSCTRHIFESSTLGVESFSRAFAGKDTDATKMRHPNALDKSMHFLVHHYLRAPKDVRMLINHTDVWEYLWDRMRQIRTDWTKQLPVSTTDHLCVRRIKWLQFNVASMFVAAAVRSRTVSGCEKFMQHKWNYMESVSQTFSDLLLFYRMEGRLRCSEFVSIMVLFTGLRIMHKSETHASFCKWNETTQYFEEPCDAMNVADVYKELEFQPQVCGTRHVRNALRVVHSAHQGNWFEYFELCKSLPWSSLQRCVLFCSFSYMRYRAVMTLLCTRPNKIGAARFRGSMTIAELTDRLMFDSIADCVSFLTVIGVDEFLSDDRQHIKLSDASNRWLPMIQDPFKFFEHLLNVKQRLSFPPQRDFIGFQPYEPALQQEESAAVVEDVMLAADETFESPTTASATDGGHTSTGVMTSSGTATTTSAGMVADVSSPRCPINCMDILEPYCPMYTEDLANMELVDASEEQWFGSIRAARRTMLGLDPEDEEANDGDSFVTESDILDERFDDDNDEPSCADNIESEDSNILQPDEAPRENNEEDGNDDDLTDTAALKAVLRAAAAVRELQESNSIYDTVRIAREQQFQSRLTFEVVTEPKARKLLEEASASSFNALGEAEAASRHKMLERQSRAEKQQAGPLLFKVATTKAAITPHNGPLLGLMEPTPATIISAAPSLTRVKEIQTTPSLPSTASVPPFSSTATMVPVDSVMPIISSQPSLPNTPFTPFGGPSPTVESPLQIPRSTASYKVSAIDATAAAAAVESSGDAKDPDDAKKKKRSRIDESDGNLSNIVQNVATTYHADNDDSKDDTGGSSTHRSRLETHNQETSVNQGTLAHHLAVASSGGSSSAAAATSILLDQQLPPSSSSSVAQTRSAAELLALRQGAYRDSLKRALRASKNTIASFVVRNEETTAHYHHHPTQKETTTRKEIHSEATTTSSYRIKDWMSPFLSLMAIVPLQASPVTVPLWAASAQQTGSSRASGVNIVRITRTFGEDDSLGGGDAGGIVSGGGGVEMTSIDMASMVVVCGDLSSPSASTTTSSKRRVSSSSVTERIAAMLKNLSTPTSERCTSGCVIAEADETRLLLPTTSTEDDHLPTIIEDSATVVGLPANSSFSSFYEPPRSSTTKTASPFHQKNSATLNEEFHQSRPHHMADGFQIRRSAVAARRSRGGSGSHRLFAPPTHRRGDHTFARPLLLQEFYDTTAVNSAIDTGSTPQPTAAAVVATNSIVELRNSVACYVVASSDIEHMHFNNHNDSSERRADAAAGQQQHHHHATSITLIMCLDYSSPDDAESVERQEAIVIAVAKKAAVAAAAAKSSGTSQQQGATYVAGIVVVVDTPNGDAGSIRTVENIVTETFWHAFDQEETRSPRAMGCTATVNTSKRSPAAAHPPLGRYTPKKSNEAVIDPVSGFFSLRKTHQPDIMVHHTAVKRSRGVEGENDERPVLVILPVQRLFQQALASPLFLGSTNYDWLVGRGLVSCLRTLTEHYTQRGEVTAETLLSERLGIRRRYDHNHRSRPTFSDCLAHGQSAGRWATGQNAHDISG
ncbi:Hypothetical protein, putative [Bodo saltans]|uniref:SAC3/GANP/THP3 conserved domain-containing protein n=1 Tax=Bodo saltans TaxID=75058 RepID=A0A0S4IKZ0_BODSA|nr:Hypothetical protein, putative [Bodo saltans]|eukprot:CUE64119.1 Hypothetical protein, putative [Bodo saltans]